MKRGRGNYGALSVLPVVLCMVMVFCLGVWYEREYGLQKEHTGRLMYTATVASRSNLMQDKSLAWETFIATAYCPCALCCGKTDGITASGVKSIEGITIAADWDVLPEGTIVEIEGLGYRIVQDTGSAIKGHRIDIYFEEHEEALEFGLQEVRVRILR